MAGQGTGNHRAPGWRAGTARLVRQRETWSKAQGDARTKLAAQCDARATKVSAELIDAGCAPNPDPVGHRAPACQALRQSAAKLTRCGSIASSISSALDAQAAQLASVAQTADDASLPVETRARAYLHSNCAHCHIKWGGGNAEFKLLIDLYLKDMGIVNVNPQHGNFKIDGAKLLVPGLPEKSIILHRMNMTGLGRMPHIASTVVDEQAVKLLRDWITNLSQEQLLTQPGAIHPRRAEGSQ